MSVESENGENENQDAVSDETGDAAREDAQEAVIEESPVTAQDQIADLNDQLLRALAELENTRRRAERDRAEALKYGAMNFARDMVGVSDNLQRALKAIEDTDDAAKADLPEAVQALLEGVAATQRDLMAALARHKVTPLAPLGEKFDPNHHEALFEAPGTGQEAGTIIDVVETGYMMQDRLLRPAKVGIAKA
jgi:molecular chaperone GrpE